jgi:hypothetical protein
MNILHWSFIILLYTKITGSLEANWLVVFIPILLYLLYLFYAYAQYVKSIKLIQAQFGSPSGSQQLLAPRRAPSLRVVEQDIPGAKPLDDDDDTPKVH